jgi:hypothetical protein
MKVFRLLAAIFVAAVAAFGPVSPAVQANPGCGGGSGGGGNTPC